MWWRVWGMFLLGHVGFFIDNGMDLHHTLVLCHRVLSHLGFHKPALIYTLRFWGINRSQWYWIGNFYLPKNHKWKSLTLKVKSCDPHKKNTFSILTTYICIYLSHTQPLVCTKTMVVTFLLSEALLLFVVTLLVSGFLFASLPLGKKREVVTKAATQMWHLMGLVYLPIFAS